MAVAVAVVFAVLRSSQALELAGVSSQLFLGVPALLAGVLVNLQGFRVFLVSSDESNRMSVFC